MKFRMVDRITEFAVRKRICGIKTVSFEEYQLKENFGEDAKLPESLVIESLFQLGNWLIMLSSDFSQMGFIIRFDKNEFMRTVCPGSHIEMVASVRRYRQDGIVFDGHAAVDGVPVASGWGCLAVPVPLDIYINPADMKMLFSEIYKPGKQAAIHT